LTAPRARRMNESMARLGARLLPLISSLALGGCGGCEATSLGPVPGGYPASEQSPRALEVALTDSGLAALSRVLLDAAPIASSCVAPEDLACPTGLFLAPSGGPLDLACGPSGTCVEAGSGAPVALFSARLPESTRGTITLCERGADGASLAPCEVHLLVEDLRLALSGSGGLEARLAAQLATSTIAVTLAGPSPARCLLSLRPGAQARTLLLSAPLTLSSRPGGEPQVAVGALPVSLAGQALVLEPDPAGDPSSATLCPPLLPALESALASEVERRARTLLEVALAESLGQRCTDDAVCPAGTSCGPGGRCSDASGVVLEVLRLSERIAVPPLLGDLGYASAGAVLDVGLETAGAARAGREILSVPLRGGVRPALLDTRCAAVRPSPRLDPAAPAPVPLTDIALADLDFDGAPETPFDLALGLGRGFLGEALWASWSAGLVCGRAGTEEERELHTGTLEVLIPSLRFLTKSHLRPRAEAPVRFSVSLREPPRVEFGEGRITAVPDQEPIVEAPLMNVALDDLQLEVFALVDERWTRLVTIQLDLALGLGLMVTPDDELLPVISAGAAELVTDVRVTNAGLLAEPPGSIEMAIPTLVQLAFFEAAGPTSPIPLPEIAGLSLDVLGVRGEGPLGADRFASTVVYGRARDGAPRTNLTPAAETHAAVLSSRLPHTEAFAVTHPGGPTRPELELALSGIAPAGGPLEWQTRVDGGPWSPFGRRSRLTLRGPELLVQGLHRIEVRAREVGAHRSLDPTPTTLEVWIDTEPPRLAARRIGDEEVEVEVHDRVSRDAVEVSVELDGRRAPLALDDAGRARIHELAEPGTSVVLVARDQAGREARLTLKEGGAPDEVATLEAPRGCRCAGARRDAALPLLGALFALARLRRRR
jgi:hypothetical protein